MKQLILLLLTLVIVVVLAAKYLIIPILGFQHISTGDSTFLSMYLIGK